MSDRIKVSTQDIKNVAVNVGNVNNEIQDGFVGLMNVIQDMLNCWNGYAADEAGNTYNNIKKSFEKSRYSVLENYRRFLYFSVGENYEIVENTNKKLADSFK